MSELRFLDVTVIRERDKPARYVARLQTPEGLIREVPLAVSELAAMAQRSVTLLAKHVDYRGPDA